ncbi:hypothetical protein BY458DRAFT_520141 [Sporodiniella umbellata]|nr:hypothetical protein BY458DRAFT_520141 [Sporodiniella umbellata]
MLPNPFLMTYLSIFKKDGCWSYYLMVVPLFPSYDQVLLYERVDLFIRVRFFLLQIETASKSGILQHSRHLICSCLSYFSLGLFVSFFFLKKNTKPASHFLLFYDC